MQRLITFLFAIGIIFISSCSIDKRLYRQGWHVQIQTQKHNNTLIKEREVYRKCERENLGLNTAENSVDLYAQTNSNTQNEITPRADFIIKPQQQFTYSKKYADYINEKLKTATETDTTKVNYIRNDKVPFHPAAITGFISGLIGSALGLIAFLVFDGVLLFLLGGLLGIVGLIVSIGALKDIYKYPQKWKGIGLGIAGIVLSTVSLGIFLSVLLLTILFLTIFW